MSNTFYLSVLSQLAQVAPMFAKPLLDKAIEKKGKNSDSVAAIELLEIIKSEINPKLSRHGQKTNSLTQASTGFIIYSSDNEILFLGPMIKKILGQPPINNGDLFEQLEEMSFCRKISELHSHIAFEVELKSKKQTFDVTIAPFFNNEMKIIGATSFIRDITLRVAIEDEVIEQSRMLREEMNAREKAQKELEINQEQLIHTSKLAGLGEMASGIAHEINNPLAVVFGGIELLEMNSKKDILDQALLAKGVERIRFAAKRIKHTVEAMRTLSRGDDQSGMIPYSLNKLLSDVLSLCREKYSASGVQTIVESEKDHIIKCHPVELGQVFINLLNNSYDAIFELKQKFIRIKVSSGPGFVIVSVIDSGPGIPPEVERRMFDPFFTTKPVGKGVGIGMSISKKIINIHGGTLAVDRKSPNTKIDVQLPL